MPHFKSGIVGWVVLALAGGVFSQPLPGLPPESTSKIKRVLLFNKVGGWVATEGIKNTTQYLTLLARSKGFALDTLFSDSALTLEFLKRYQVIVWNNNSNGQASVPSAAARTAVVDYVRQGGGWLLLGLAGDHGDTWSALKEMMGTKFIHWGATDTADMLADSSALKHPELRFVVNSLPHRIRLTDAWMTFENTVRPLEGVTVLYTRQGNANSVRDNADGRGDNTHAWARTLQKGKLLFCPTGWSIFPISTLAQADSAVAKLYWYSMRWLAGDFQNGCTDPQSPHFNAEARVDDGSCAGGVALQPKHVLPRGGRSIEPNLKVGTRAPRRLTVPSARLKPESLERELFRDARGRKFPPR